MITKKCKHCGEEKLIKLFLKDSRLKSGYASKCKFCHNKICRRYISANQQYYTRKSIEYRKTDKGKIKSSANQKVKTALRSGKLFKEPCSVCGNIKSEAHHSDYREPLNIIWLCSLHHKEWHANNKIYGI